MSKEQMNEMARNIIARRKNPNYRASTETHNPTATSQHEAEVAKILKRRGTKAQAKADADRPAVNFDLGDDEVIADPVITDVVPPVNEDMDVTDPVVETNEVIPAPIYYHEMDKKTLRIECDKLGIKYKKKDTNEKLIGKLTGVQDGGSK